MNTAIAITILTEYTNSYYHNYMGIKFDSWHFWKSQNLIHQLLKCLL